MPKKVSMSLNPNSIQNAIDELKTYRSKLVELKTEVVKGAVSRGVDLARSYVQIMDAYESGSLLNHIEPIYTDSGKGYVFSGAPHSAFVEFGTGLRGSQNPHPTPPQGWAYDVNEHGEQGWVYYDSYRGKFFVTRGAPSAPFMYLTAKQLKSETASLVKDAIKEVRLDD